MRWIASCKRFWSLVSIVALIISLVGIPPAEANANSAQGKVVLAGDLQTELGAAADWDPGATATEMIPLGDGYYEFTGRLPAGTYEYKVAIDGKWNESYGYGNYSNPDGKGKGDNIQITLPYDSDVTFYYHHGTHRIADSTFYIPIEPDKLPRIIGSFQTGIGEPADWSPANSRMVLTDADYDNVYTVTVSVYAGNHEFQVILGTDEASDPVYPAGREELGLPEDSNVTFTYDATTNAVAAEYSVPTGDAGQVQPKEAPPVPADHLRIHYQRTDGNYGNMGLWIFDDVAAPSDNWPSGATPFPTGQVDEYGAFVDIKLTDSPQKVGIVVVNRVSGEKDGGDKKFAIVSPDMNEVWLKQGSDTVYQFEPADLPDDTIRVHYAREDDNHSDYALWLWGDVAEPSTDWPVGATKFPAGQKDRYGAYVDIKMKADAQKINFLVVDPSKGDSGKDGGDKSFGLPDRYRHLFIKQEDDNVYISPYNELAIGLVSAEILSPGKLRLGFTMTAGLEADSLRNELQIKDKNGDSVPIDNVEITGATIVEVKAQFGLDSAPLNVTYSGKTVSASTGWRMLDEMYYYGGDDLGATYRAGGATLKLWAPLAEKVAANFYDKDDATKQIGTLELAKGEQGVWSIDVEPGDLGVQDFRGYYYQYEVTNQGVTKKVLDPYAKSMAEFRVDTKGEAVGPDGDTVGKAAIVDLSGTDPAADYGFANIPGYEKREDAIIWEIHVRDFTSDPSIQDDLHTSTWGTFDAFKSKLDYIKSLGVTHVQLLPVMAWYYGDEAAMKERELEYSAKDNEYNWGYDPHNYFSPDGAYSENPRDPELRIRELKAMIHAIHEADMGVILDVVYTHMAKADFLNDIVPNYYAFQDANGNFIGGFGNNLATNRKMAEKLMIDSVTYWFDEYKIDGMRWDMMGDATYEAVQNAYNAAAAIHPNALFIGEGWRTFGGHLSDPSLEGQGADQDWMDQTDDVGVFSDEFRNELKSGFGSEGEPRFITGGARDIGVIFNNIKAQPGNTPADSPGDMVQYIEAHDNLTLYDVIAQSIKKDPAVPANDLEIHKRIRLGNLLTLTSQGTAFLHAGQEYGRTKQWKGEGVPEQKYHKLMDEAGKPFGYFIHDSYDSSDAVNMFDWEKAANEDRYPVNAATREYTAGLIELRKSTDAFRLGDQTLVNSNVTLMPIPEIQSQDLVIAYENRATDGTGIYYVFVNADHRERTLTLDHDLTKGAVLVDNDEAGTAEVSVKSGFVLTPGSITLDPLTAVVIKLDAPPSVLESLTADKDNYLLQVGTTHQTAIYANYDDGSIRNVTKRAAYASSNPHVAAVTATGLVQAVAEGTAVIQVSYGGIRTDISVTVTADPVDDKRYLQFNYIRPDRDYTDWNIWVWNTGVKNDQIDFTGFENGIATALIEVAPETTSVGFVLRKGKDWATGKQDVPDDRIIPLTPGESFTKVNVTSMVRELDILPSIQGPELADGNITFLYRDDKLFRIGKMDSITNVQVKINGKLHAMSYDPAKEWFGYTLPDVQSGTYVYTFIVTRNGETVEITDPKNTVNGVSQVVYHRPTVDIEAAVNPGAIAHNENAVVTIRASSAEPVAFREAYIDLTELGGPAKVKLDNELMEQSIAVKEPVAAGSKTIAITLVDQYGNQHKGSAAVTVKARNYGGKLDFDWDEARIYFVLTDRFMDGDESNNFNVDKSHPEAYHGGDFRGLIDKLDYIQDLGVNTLWITPIVDNIDFNKGADFNGKQYGYHGYWAKDFTKIDEHLGDLDTFKELIDKAHDRGIKIMVDIVLNHTGYGLKPGDNRPGITQEDKDRFAGMLRTDEISADVDPIKGELAGLPDFITENPDVRRQIIDWQAGWLERARTKRGDTIDYFRVDTVKHVEDTTWKAFKNTLTQIDPKFKLIGEYFGATVDSDGGTLQSGQMDSLLDFGFKGRARDFVNGDVESVEAYLADREAKLDNTRMMGQFLSSHDEDGFLSHYVNGDKAKLMAAAALQITSKGQPVIYYGEELGRSGKNAGDMSKGEFSENRGDMPWDRLDAERKLHSHYKKLLNIRAQYSKVFSKGTRTTIAASNDKGYLAFGKRYEGQNAVTAINVKNAEQTVTMTVPFAAGSKVKDVYSGKDYRVASDRNVTIVLPAMADGGTAVLVSAESEGGGGGDGSGSSGRSENSGKSGMKDKAIEANPGQKFIIEETLRSGEGEKVSVDLEADVNEVLLPLRAAEMLGSKFLELKKGGLTIMIPSALLKDLQHLIGDDQASGTLISFKVNEVSSASALSLLAKAKAVEKARLNLAGKMFDIDLSAIAKDGKEYRLDRFAAPMTLRFDLEAGMNAKWTSVYFVADSGKLEYAGGKRANGKLIAEVFHLGKYAALEYDKTFADMEGHWAESAVKELAAMQVVNGTGDGKFSPGQRLTRAEFAAMLVRAMALNLSDEESAEFADVDSDAWYASYVAAAYRHGLVHGKGGNLFAPHATITREEMAVMLVRACRIIGEVELAGGEAASIADVEQIASWAAQDVHEAVSNGLMRGRGQGQFAPKAATTRAESAQAVLNLLHKLQ
ncbi:pullulanase [Paenibacillus sp. CECT 9249]|uniref:pullulanase n=1 Tax=Paenibacillus sp. CECT 9249 TaxID=2845385 RepID=UPI001E3EB04B|nr:pullulanase [Paenibacillus sp. CECT 9249]